MKIDELSFDFSGRDLEHDELEQLVESLKQLSDRAKIQFWMNLFAKENMTEFTIANEKKLKELLFNSVILF